jgi:hypothetical protein
VGRLGRWFRGRLVAGADLLGQAELKVSPDDELRPEVSQVWHVEGDRRAWVEPFMVVGYATKMVTNFRGDAALGVWLSITGEAATTSFELVDSLDKVGGTYAAQVFEREGQAPFIQTPASGGSRRSRELEVAGTARALRDALAANGPDSADRVDSAMTVMEAMGTPFAESPSIRGANEVTWSVMRVLEERGNVPTL